MQTNLEIRVQQKSGSSASTKRKKGWTQKNVVTDPIKAHTFGVRDTHMVIIKKLIDTGLFSSEGEVVRFCISNSIPTLYDMIKDFIDMEVVMLDDTYVKLVRRLD